MPVFAVGLLHQYFPAFHRGILCCLACPGDPLISCYCERVEKMSPWERAWAEEKLGLADPIHVQYIRWLGNALKRDFVFLINISRMYVR